MFFGSFEDELQKRASLEEPPGSLVCPGHASEGRLELTMRHLPDFGICNQPHRHVSGRSPQRPMSSFASETVVFNDLIDLSSLLSTRPRWMASSPMETPTKIWLFWRKPFRNRRNMISVVRQMGKMKTSVGYNGKGGQSF